MSLLHCDVRNCAHNYRHVHEGDMAGNVRCVEPRCYTRTKTSNGQTLVGRPHSHPPHIDVQVIQSGPTVDCEDPACPVTTRPHFHPKPGYTVVHDTVIRPEQATTVRNVAEEAVTRAARNVWVVYDDVCDYLDCTATCAHFHQGSDQTPCVWVGEDFTSAAEHGRYVSVHPLSPPPGTIIVTRQAQLDAVHGHNDRMAEGFRCDVDGCDVPDVHQHQGGGHSWGSVANSWIYGRNFYENIPGGVQWHPPPEQHWFRVSFKDVIVSTPDGQTAVQAATDLLASYAHGGRPDVERGPEAAWCAVTACEPDGSLVPRDWRDSFSRSHIDWGDIRTPGYVIPDGEQKQWRQEDYPLVTTTAVDPTVVVDFQFDASTPATAVKPPRSSKPKPGVKPSGTPRKRAPRNPATTPRPRKDPS